MEIALIIFFATSILQLFSGHAHSIQVAKTQPEKMAAFGGPWGIAGGVHFPNLVKDHNDASLSLTIHNSSSSELTLRVMLIIAVIGMPLVFGYTIYLFKVFKGKVRTEDKDY